VVLAIVHSIHFSSGLDQFHYNDILFNLVELANQQGHVAKTSGIPMDYFIVMTWTTKDKGEWIIPYDS